jgi:hypothetical protein
MFFDSRKKRSHKHHASPEQIEEMAIIEDCELKVGWEYPSEKGPLRITRIFWPEYAETKDTVVLSHNNPDGTFREDGSYVYSTPDAQGVTTRILYIVNGVHAEAPPSEFITMIEQTKAGKCRKGRKYKIPSRTDVTKADKARTVAQAKQLAADDIKFMEGAHDLESL